MQCILTQAKGQSVLLARRHRGRLVARNNRAGRLGGEKSPGSSILSFSASQEASYVRFPLFSLCTMALWRFGTVLTETFPQRKLFLSLFAGQVECVTWATAKPFYEAFDPGQRFVVDGSMRHVKPVRRRAVLRSRKASRLRPAFNECLSSFHFFVLSDDSTGPSAGTRQPYSPGGTFGVSLLG